MKRILCLIFALLLLAGCQQSPPASEVPDTSTPTQVEPESVPTDSATLMERGTPWDGIGALLSVPLQIPDRWTDGNLTGYQDKLLLWGYDTYREGPCALCMRLIDPVTGQIIYHAEVESQGFLPLQVLEDRIYLCDNLGGKVTELNSSLQVTQQWQTQANYGQWYMGQNNTLYQIVDNASIIAIDLQTGQTQTVIDHVTDILIYGITGSNLALEYSDADTHDPVCAVLDLTDGTLYSQPYDGEFYNCFRIGQTWLCCSGYGSDVYYLGTDDAAMRVNLDNRTLLPVRDGYLLEDDYYNQIMRIYDLDGKFLSVCDLSYKGYSYVAESMVWNQQAGGFFFLMEDFSGKRQMAFWDVNAETAGKNLVLEAVPAPAEQTQALQQRCDALQQQYGVEILIGERCRTEFSDFTASQTENYEMLSLELDALQSALEHYPDGFFRQIQFDDVQGIQIQLVDELMPKENRSWPDKDAYAFSYVDGSKIVVVADAVPCMEETYFLEFSHCIDLYLEHDAQTRNDALYSEDGWMALNPEGFAYSYGETAGYDPINEGVYFVDSNSAVSPSQDRARIMATAMAEYVDGQIFEDKPFIREKLAYYSLCIRDAFDTTGWPETTVWEQYLQQ